MSSRRGNNQQTEARRRYTTTTREASICNYPSSNLLDLTQMHDVGNTTSGSGCSQSRLVKQRDQNQSGQHPENSELWHLLLFEATINLMPTRVSSTLLNLDTQVNCSSPLDNTRRMGSTKPLDRYCKLNASSIVATLWLLSSCCLVLMMATNPGQCAPTTQIASHLPIASSSLNFHNNNNNNQRSPHSQVVRDNQLTATNQQQIIMTNEPVVSGAVDVQRIIIVNPAHHESSKGHESSSGSVTPAHHKVDKLVGAEDGSSIEDEIILMVLAGESSPSSIRLMKRSGISDQRLAEIQMIRALKKQMERAATKIAAESGGNGASGNAGGDVE